MKNIEYFCYLVFELEQKYDIITRYNLKNYSCPYRNNSHLTRILFI